jgi:uncharacterized membrane protein
MGDPYQPPTVDVSPPDVRSANTIQVFEKFSTWYVLGLTFITLGLYSVYWLFSRSRRLNKLKYIEPVSETYMQVTAAAWVLSYPVGIGEIYMQDNASYLLFSRGLEIATAMMILVWAFMFRNRLNTFLEHCSVKTSRLSPVLTFFFNVLYLSFKVNQNLELAEEPVQEPEEQGGVV